jgi:hypothetical protein
MERRQIGYLVAAVGALLVVVSALADPIGVGEGGGFGWKQAVGIVVGAVLVAIGGWLLYARGSKTPASES